MLESTLFKDTFASCGINDDFFNDGSGSSGDGTTKGKCFIKHDGLYDFTGSMTVSAINVNTGISTKVFDVEELVLVGGKASSKWFDVNWNLEGDENFDSTHILKVNIEAKDSSYTFEDIVLLTTPKNYNLKKNKLTVEVQGDKILVSTAEASALYVTLTTLAKGRFSENVFFLRKDEVRSIIFLPINPGEESVDISLLEASLRIEDLAVYL